MTNQDNATRLEKHLLKTQFPFECKELPLEQLNPDELKVVSKCISQKDLTDEEFVLLKKTLQRYREAINKHKPTQTIESVKQTVQIIRTEQDLLDILDNPINKTLKVNLPYNGQKYPMEFEILPVDDSRIVDYMQMNIDLFKDYNEDERQLFMKSQNGEKLSPEEVQIIDKMNKEINALASQEKSRVINGFLASQLRLPESSTDYKKREEFWDKFPFMEKWAIVTKVEEKLGLTEKSNEELFPDE